MSLGCFECRLYEKSNSFSSPLSLSLFPVFHTITITMGRTERLHVRASQHLIQKTNIHKFSSVHSSLCLHFLSPFQCPTFFHAHLHFLSIVIFNLFIIFTPNLCTTNASLFVFILLLCLPKVLLKCRLAALTIYTLQMNKII